jgi:hypothetical protein
VKLNKNGEFEFTSATGTNPPTNLPPIIETDQVTVSPFPLVFPPKP